jgi:hypothetical protein
MAGAFSKYTPAIVQFARTTGGAAVYCFVVDGHLGTGGMPLVVGLLPPDEYRQRCEELISLLRRSADLLEQDIARQVPREQGDDGAGSVG